MFLPKKDLAVLKQQLATLNENPEQHQLLFSETANSDLQAIYGELTVFLEYHRALKLEYEQTRLQSQRMLANISHDIKTPLTVLSGLTELIDLEERTSAENKAYLEQMKEKTQEVIDMVQAFFDLNKLESSDVMLNLTCLDVGNLCKKILLSQYDFIEKQGLKVDVDILDEPLPAMIDEQAFTRIVENLLMNAITYGALGGIIGLRVKKVGDFLDVIVWDKGKGIEEKYYSQVFERLFTLEDSRNKNYSGSGLGLTIIKRLTEKQGGTITLQSVPYQYTEFKVTLPIAHVRKK